MNGILYGVGVGPGAPDLLTLRAVKVLGEVDVILAAASPRNDFSAALDTARPHLREDVRVLRLEFPMTRDRAVLHEAWRVAAHPATQAGLRTETLLMFAARQQHIEDVILPALADGINVVSDRFTDATFAYQGGGRGVPFADIETLENWVQGGLRPDLTLLLDVPLEVSMSRIAQAREKDRFEQEQADFFTRVRAAYLKRAAAAPERYAVIDSNRDLGEVKHSIEAVLGRHFQVV